MWPFRKKEAIETRSSGAGYTAQIMAARAAYISGGDGIAELTATAQGCISLWEGGLGLADVKGTDFLDRQCLALTARSLALRGEAVFLIRDRLIPCSDWDLTTRNSKPTAYRLGISEAGGGRTETALAGEVLHFRIASDVSAPYHGTPPLRRSQLTAGLLNALETALFEAYQNAPLGTSIVPYPESDLVELENMSRSLMGKRGRVVMRESVNSVAAGGASPNTDWKPQDISPDLSRSMTRESLAAARDGVAMAFGVLPGLSAPATTGPLVREAQRHLAQWMLQPIASAMAEECTEKLGDEITLDVMRPLQAFDAGGRARAITAIVGALAEAKQAGIDPEKAMQMVDWGNEY